MRSLEIADEHGRIINPTWRSMNSDRLSGYVFSCGDHLFDGITAGICQIQ
jgi:hypothetical protein